MTEQTKNTEEKIERLDFKKLKALPDKYANALWKIRERLVKALDKVKSQAAKNYLEKTVFEVESFAEKLNADFTPAPPKHLDDAHKYALTRKYSGTYLALLDADDNLVKVLIVEKDEMLDKMPPIKLVEKPVKVEMNSKFVFIEGSDFGKTDKNPDGGRAVSKRVVKAVPFCCNKDKVFEYKNGEMIR